MADTENILNLNKKALQIITETQSMILLQQGLEQIEKLPENQKPHLLSITYNNMACYYRYQGKPHVALQYLIYAQKIESNFANQNNASTNLNLCAVYQDLKKYDQALKCAQLALKELQTFQTDEKVKFQIALAYLSIGTQYEFLRKKKECFTTYEQGYQYCLTNLGKDKNLTIQLQNLSNNFMNYKTSSHERSTTQYQADQSLASHRDQRKSSSVYYQSPIKISPPRGEQLCGKKLADKLEKRKVSRKIKFPSLYQ